VINDLRLCFKDEVAQIDHLLVTCFGLFIIESKSVYGTVSFNSHGDWVRIHNQIKSGMPSPIMQAELQGKLIKDVLRNNDKELRGTLLGMQKGFGYCPVEIRVAISNGGIIERGYDEPRVLKADMVVNSIQQRVKKLKSAASLFSLTMNDGWTMSSVEAWKVATFLVSENTPIAIATPKATIEAPLVLAAGNDCPKCKSGKLVNRKGKTQFLGCSNYPKCKFTDYQAR
jgi:hypothetical protein